MEKLNLPPNPVSLVESMRDIGYSIETAVADIIDNSITAKATRIDIRFSWNSGNPWLAIIDNGCGMDKDKLISAMRLGSMSPLDLRESEDLGRFGLGLKTASFSQCRCLTVVSKYKNQLSGAQWDLNSISDSDNKKWLLNILNQEEFNKESTLSELTGEYLGIVNSGTIVFWQNIDRLLKISSSKESKFNEIINEIKSHLELVFHRYLSSNIGVLRIEILFNKSSLIAYDPFNINKSTELRSEEFLYEGKHIKVQPYVLPYHSDVSKSEWQKYAGKNGYLQEQGFYVYRNKRLIIYSTWFRLLPKTELTKLLRVKVDIPNSLDHLWRIDIRKSNAFPPEGIRDILKNIIGKIEFAGKNVYERRGGKVLSKIDVPIWERIVKDKEIYYQINLEHPIINSYEEGLSDKQKVLFFNIISTIETTFPKTIYFNDLASNPQGVMSKILSKEQIEEMLELFIDKNMKDIPKSKIEELLQMDPFASNRELTEQIFRERKYEF